MEHNKRSSLRKHVMANKGNQQSTTKRRISFNNRKSIREFNQEQKETRDYDISDRSDPYSEDASYKHINKVTSTIKDPITKGVCEAGNDSLEYINKPILNTVLNIEYSVDVTLFDDEPHARNRYSENLLKKSLLNEPNNCEGDKYKSENSHVAATTINEHKADHLSKINQQSEKLHTIVGSVSENCQSLPPPPKVYVEDMDISPSSDTEIKCKDNTRTPYNKTKVNLRQICLPSPALKSLAPVNQRLLAYYKNKQKDKMNEELNATPAEPSSPINEVKKSLNFSFSTWGNESPPLYPPGVNTTNLRQLNDDLESGKLQVFAERKARALPEHKRQNDKYHCRFSQADDLMLDNTSFLTQAKLGNESTLRNSSKKSLNGLDICDDTLFFTQSSFQDRFPVNSGGAGYLKGTVNAQEGSRKSLNLESNKKPLEDAQDVISYGLEMEIEAESKENNTKRRQTMILQEKIEDVGVIQRIIKDRKATKKELYQANPKFRRTMILNHDIEPENIKSAFRKEHSGESRRTMILHENIEEDTVEDPALIDDVLSKHKEVSQVNPKSRKTMILNQDIEPVNTISAVRKEHSKESRRTLFLHGNIEEDTVEDPALIDDDKHKEISQVNPKSRKTMILNQDIEPENTISAVRKEHSRESRRTLFLHGNIEEDKVEDPALIDDDKHKEISQVNPKSRKTMILNQDIESENIKSAFSKEHSGESRRTMILHENIEENDVLFKDKTINAISTELPQVKITRRTQKAYADSQETPQANPMLRKIMIFNREVEIESPTGKENNTGRKQTMILQENMDGDTVEDDVLSKHKEVFHMNPKSRKTMILNQDIEPENIISAVRKEHTKESRRTLLLHENIEEDTVEDPALIDDVLSKHKEVSQVNPKSRKTMILNEEIESVSCTKSAVCKENITGRRQTMILHENLEDVVVRPADLPRDKEITKNHKTMILNEEIELESTPSITRKDYNQRSGQTETLQENIERDVGAINLEILYETNKTIKETSTGIPQSRITRSMQKKLLSSNADCRQAPEENSELPKPRILKQINQEIQNKMEQTVSSRERECGSFKDPTKIMKERPTLNFNETNERIDTESIQTCQKSLVESKEIDHVKQEFLEASFNSEKLPQTLSAFQCSNVRIAQNKGNIECFSTNREFSPNKRLTINVPQDINITQDFDNIENFAKPEKSTRFIKKSRESIYREESMDLEENTEINKASVEHNQQTLYLNTNIKEEGKALNESTSALLDQDDQDFSKSQANIYTEQRMDIDLDLDLDCQTNVGNGNRAVVHLNTGKETQPKLTLNYVKMEANTFEEQVLDEASSVNKLLQSSCCINDDQFRTPLKTSANQERLRKMCEITPRQSLLEFTRLEKNILKQSSANFPTPRKGYQKTKTNYFALAANITSEDFDGSLDAKATKPKPKPFKVEISGLELNDSVAERTGIEQQQPPFQIMSYNMTDRISTLAGEAFDESQNNRSIQVLRNVSTSNKWSHVKSLVLPSTSEESMEQCKSFDDNTISVPDVTKYLNEPSCSNISALPQIQCHILNDPSIQFIEEEQLTLVDNINIEDDDDKEVLIEEIRDESDSEDDLEDEQQQACGSIVNDGNNTTFLCRKCKRCQQTLTDETLTSDKSESFVLPVAKPLPSIGLEKLLRSRQKLKLADLDDLWRSLDDDIDSTQNITKDETLMASSVDGVKDDLGTWSEMECGFIRGYKKLMAKFEKEIKEKYDKLYKDPPLPVVESLKNELSNNPKMSHWIFDYQLEICGLLMFVHRQLLTFKLKIIYDAICPLGTEIHIKTIKTCDRVKQSMWKPIDYILDFQLKLQMPSNVQTMCKGHDAESIYKMLETLNHMIENTVKLGRELQIVAFKFDASLKTDGPNRYYMRKILRRVVKSPDTYDRVEKLEFQIDVYNIQALNFRNIAKPRLHNFQEDIQLLPTGIEFLNVFLSDPLKFIKPELKQSIFH